MEAIDIILIISALVGFAIGFFRGIIEMMSLTTGVIFALAQSSALLPWFTKLVDNAIGVGHWLSMALGFVLLIVVSIVIFKILGKILGALLDALHMRIVDQIAGGLFSAYIAFMLAKAVVNMF